MDKINKILKIPQYEQRSDMWFKQRHNKLTSSDAATVIGINPYQKSHEVLFKKCGYDPKPFVGNIATKHGQKYEDEAINKYCDLTGQINYNFGLISHQDVYNNEDYIWLAGSPDGISIDKNNQLAEPVLLEVKCPYRRKIIFGKIPEYYLPQVQLNMFICNLNIADFIEYCPPDVMNIVRIYRDEKWLRYNLPILKTFWDSVEYYRLNDIKYHPKYPKQKNILDFTTNDTESSDTHFNNYMIRD
jgi:putative phage-type endonuclease